MRRLVVIGLLILLTFPVWGQEGQTVRLARGKSVTLNANSEGAISYAWYRNGVFISGATQASLLVSEAGVYTVVGVGLICDSDLSDPVEVIITDEPAPAKSVDMHIANHPDRTAVLVGQPITYQVIVTNQGAEKATHVKVHIQLAPEVTYDQIEGMYSGEVLYNRSEHSITWTLDAMESGQSEAISILVQSKEAGQAGQLAVVSSLEPELRPLDNEAYASVDIVAFRIPNVFTPNGDGINDSFEILGLEFLRKADLTIFNAAGVEVYRNVNYQNNWDGSGWDGSGLAPGVYFYLLNVQFDDGKEHVFKGHVTILRD